MDLAASAGETAAASSPEVTAGFAAALLDSDAAGASSLFAPTGWMLTADGTEVIGPRAIEAILRQLVGSENRLEIRIGRTIEAGAVASARRYWRRSGPDGAAVGFDQTTRATLVLGREAGLWSILSASPWG